MSSEALIVSFPDASTAEGNRLASTLADALRDVDSSIVVDRQRERSDTQDFGASLAVMLGTAALCCTDVSTNRGNSVRERRATPLTRFDRRCWPLRMVSPARPRSWFPGLLHLQKAR